MRPGQQQQTGGDDHQAQQLHRKQVSPGEGGTDQRIVTHGQSHDDADGGGQGHRRRRGADGEQDHPPRPPHIQSRAAQAPREKARCQDLEQVQHGIQPDEWRGVSAHNGAQQVQPETDDQNDRRAPPGQLQEGRQHHAVGGPDDHRLKGRRAPVAQQQAEHEQKDVDGGTGAGLLARLMTKRPPASAHSPLPDQSTLGQACASIVNKAYRQDYVGFPRPGSVPWPAPRPEDPRGTAARPGRSGRGRADPRSGRAD